jgi:uncharacterized protein (TIGR00297 family)
MESYIQLLLRTPSDVEWMRFAGILVGIGATIGLGEAVRRALHWPPEFTRKLVHVSVALLIFFAPNLFVTALPPLILASSFTIFAYVAIKLGLLKSLHAVARGAYGTVYYPSAVLILVFLFWNAHPEIVSLSMLALGLGDASAAIVGESIRNPRLFHLTSDKKSIQGSTAMLLTTAVGLILGMEYFDSARYSRETVALAVICSSFTATAWEALSSRALDNLTIPLSVGFVLYYFLVPTPMQNGVQFGIGVGLGLSIAVISFALRFLTASGAVATFLLASLVYGVGGWKWTVPILTFFILSSLLSKIGKSRKMEAEFIFDKTGIRDVGQVAANGGVAGILVFLQYVFQDLNFYPMYLGAVAAVTADTWGTEIGTYFKGKTVSIVTLREVTPGVSGGVSLSGLVAGVLGASIAAMSAVAWIGSGFVLLVAIVTGIIGSAVDSVMGATVQAQYSCAVCGKITERTIHCGATTEFVSGIRWINNDLVNWVCAIVGALTVLLLGSFH